MLEPLMGQPTLKMQVIQQLYSMAVICHHLAMTPPSSMNRRHFATNHPFIDQSISFYAFHTAIRALSATAVNVGALSAFVHQSSSSMVTLRPN
jgi:hypothetical protein